MMAITKKLLDLLIQDADEIPQLATEFRVQLEKIGLTLPSKMKIKKNGKEETLTLEKQIKKARFQRPEYLKILDNRESLLKALDAGFMSQTEKEKVVIMPIIF